MKNIRKKQGNIENENLNINLLFYLYFFTNFVTIVALHCVSNFDTLLPSNFA